MHVWKYVERRAAPLRLSCERIEAAHTWPSCGQEKDIQGYPGPGCCWYGNCDVTHCSVTSDPLICLSLSLSLSSLLMVGPRDGAVKDSSEEEDVSFLALAALFSMTRSRHSTDQDTLETTGCKKIVPMFKGNQSDSLMSLRYSILYWKVFTAITCVKPERLPPTPSATKPHSLQVYLKVMQWLGENENMDTTKWGHKGGVPRDEERLAGRRLSPHRLRHDAYLQGRVSSVTAVKDIQLCVLSTLS
uniref:Uncharacterized protein n=1 Tax=Timema douglasi TaxID=61478 RepID=A0A7R8ZGJ3_TIMDO|nr:unnamed protein product [Timema douglasi]